jgi:hypothetical protein
MAALSNYLENQIIDWIMRGQSYSPPANLYIALYTTAPTAAGGGVEVSGGSYARVAVASNLANWAGTQGTATTTASTGTSGLTSNNSALTYPTPTAAWGTLVAFGVFDASTGGNMLFFAGLTTAKTINNGDSPPIFQSAQLTFSLS